MEWFLPGVCSSLCVGLGGGGGGGGLFPFLFLYLVRARAGGVYSLGSLVCMPGLGLLILSDLLGSVV